MKARRSALSAAAVVAILAVLYAVRTDSAAAGNICSVAQNKNNECEAVKMWGAFLVAGLVAVCGVMLGMTFLGAP